MSLTKEYIHVTTINNKIKTISLENNLKFQSRQSPSRNDIRHYAKKMIILVVKNGIKNWIDTKMQKIPRQNTRLQHMWGLEEWITCLHFWNRKIRATHT